MFLQGHFYLTVDSTVGVPCLVLSWVILQLSTVARARQGEILVKGDENE